MPIATEQYEALAAKVLKVYEEAEQHMINAVSEKVKKGLTQPGWEERKLAEIQSVTKENRAYMARITAQRRRIQEESILEAYTGAAQAFISDARKFTETVGIAGLTPNAVKVVNILSELDSKMAEADRLILRKANDAYAEIVGESSALVATGTYTLDEAVQRETEQFAKRSISGFVDRAGRTWDIASYAEMATLTAIERATRQGYFDSMREFGYDLAQISDHYGACPICEAWQGVVISISGDTPGYLTLSDAEAAGVFHPRCMHDLGVYYPGISRGARIEPREVQPPSRAYAFRQEQRYYERQSRKWMRVANDTALPEARRRIAVKHAQSFQDKIEDLRETYNSSTPRRTDYLPRKRNREGGRASDVFG